MEKLISEFSFGLFFWQFFIFIGLILLLKKFAWKPILDTVNERETSIKDALSSAHEARKEMASLQEDNQKVLQEARAEREALLKEARISGANLLAKAKTLFKTKSVRRSMNLKIK
jgi:F-type H+-transporting ATPase subunit b